MSIDLAELGRQLQTPLGLIALVLIIVWATNAALSHRLGYTLPRTASSIWMVLYAVSLAWAYLVQIDRDLLRNYIAILVGWNFAIGWLMLGEMVAERRKRQAETHTGDQNRPIENGPSTPV